MDLDCVLILEVFVRDALPNDGKLPEIFCQLIIWSKK
jgi:hypothetical protein